MSNIINPVDLTSELIKCKSLTPKSAGSLDIIISLLNDLGFNCKKINFGEGNEKVEEKKTDANDKGEKQNTTQSKTTTQSTTTTTGKKKRNRKRKKKKKK